MSNLNPDNTGLSSSLIGWIHNFSKQQYWRVYTWYEYDDLIQDGLLIATKCRTRYQDQNLTEKQFAAKVRFAFQNHITDLANKKSTGKCINPSKYKANYSETKLEENDWNIALGTLKEDSVQFITVVYKEAPAVIKAFLSLFSSSYNLDALKKPYKNGETLNKRLCCLIGLQEETDICKLVREYFNS